VAENWYPIIAECNVTVVAEAEHIDDRCESDISGIATDDTDLSSLSSDADIAMEMGNLVYRHQPNLVFNTLLSCCTVLMVCFAVGIGVGHYFGQSAFCFLEFNFMKIILAMEHCLHVHC